MSAADGRRNGDAGIALLLVIWVSALLAGLAAQVTVDTRSAVDVAHAGIETSRARALAESGVWAAVARLLDGAAAETVRLDGSGQTFAESGGRVTVAVVDERAKLDLNVVGSVALRKLLIAVGADPSQATRAAEAVLRHRAVTARTEGPARTRAFVSVGELQYVVGISPALAKRLAPFLTVHTGDWGVNPLVAPLEVLSALPGVDTAEAVAYLELRRRYGRDPIALRLATPLGIAAHAVWTPPQVVGITAIARVPSGAAFVRKAVVELDPHDKSFQLLDWSQSPSEVQPAD